MEINEFQHPNLGWTCKSNNLSGKGSLWITYLESFKKEKGFKWTMNYKRGSVTADQDKVDCVIIYGNSGNSLVELLDALGSKKIPLDIINPIV